MLDKEFERPAGDVDDKHQRFVNMLRRLWANLPPEVPGKAVTKEQREEMLGYGPGGV